MHFLCSFIIIIICMTKYARLEFSATELKGYLTMNCVRNYERIFMKRDVPPRDYPYFHEAPPARLMTPVLSFRIIGGKKITIEDVPYQVLYGLYCGGTIIAPSWVLTAAHCKELDDFVLAGSTHRSTATEFNVCSHFTHPMWYSNEKTHSHDWDYQLLLLETPIPVTPRSRPIAIGSMDDIVDFQMITVSGWGHTHYKGEMVDVVQSVELPVVPWATCKNPSSKIYNISPRMFCAGYSSGSKDSCQGDSGGPAVSNNKLVGIVSFGIGCGEPNKPGVYAAVPLARQWIRQVTALPL